MAEPLWTVYNLQMFQRQAAKWAVFETSIVEKCSQYGESMIVLLPVSVGHSSQEPLCLREACANLTQNSGCLKTFKGQNYTRNNQLHGLLPFRIPFRCIFIYLCFNDLRDFGLARSLHVHELARSLWKACARVTPFNFLKNKFHRIAEY